MSQFLTKKIDLTVEIAYTTYEGAYANTRHVYTDRGCFPIT